MQYVLIGILLGTFVYFVVSLIFTYQNKKSKPKINNDKLAREYLGLENYVVLKYRKGTTEWLDSMIANGIKSGIKFYEESEYVFNIEFNNGVKAELWNRNKHYTWLVRGTITTIDEKTNEKVDIKYDDVQPTAFAMYKLKMAIDSFNNKSTPEIENLPKVSVSRTKIVQ